MQRLSRFQNGLIAVYARILAAANSSGDNSDRAYRCAEATHDRYTKDKDVRDITAHPSEVSLRNTHHGLVDARGNCSRFLQGKGTAAPQRRRVWGGNARGRGQEGGQTST